MGQSNESEASRNEQIRFLSDEPLAAGEEQEIRFGHLSIGENVRKIISKCPTPFTIGLFGKWGVGKTTILKVVEEKVRSDKIAVVYFDVWKHEEDALRRTFIKEAVKQLQDKKRNAGRNYLPNFTLNENLDVPIKRTFKGEFNFHGWRIGVLVCSLLALVGVAFLIKHFWPESVGYYVSIVVGGGFVTAFLLWQLSQAITAETITKTIDRFKDPHEFESEFKRLVSEITSEELLIMIDNLDRTSHKKAVELLSTIKTFLEQKKCIFLIACDDDAIKRHLEGVYTPGSKKSDSQTLSDSDEFLRKFFQASLRIPDFIDTELHTYTESILQETNAPNLDSPEIAYVIARAFRGNPRQIKQFINTLLAHYLLAEEREGGSEPAIVPKGIVTKNVAFLAKLLIIRQKYSQEEYQKFVKGETPGDPDLNEFLRVTKPIRAEDIRPFHYLRISKEELDIPGLRELEVALIDGEGEKVEEKFKALKKEPEEVTSLNKVILSLISRNRGKRLVLSNIVSSLLHASQRQDMQLNPVIYNEIANILSDDSEFGVELQDLDAPLIFNKVLSQCNEIDRDAIIHRYIKSVSKQKESEETDYPSSSYVQAVFTQLIGHKDWLGDKKQEASKALSDSYYNYEILSIFRGRPDDQREFVSEEIIVKFVSTLSDDDVEAGQSINDKIGLLLDFEEVVGADSLQATITKLSELLGTENQQPYRPEKENLLTCVENILDTFGEVIAVLSQEILDPFADAVIQGMAAIENWTQKRMFVVTCLWLVLNCEDPIKSKINGVIRPFLKSADVESTAFVFQRLKSNQQMEVINIYNDIFQQRVSQDQQIFDLLYPLAPKDTRTPWLMNLIQSDHQRALTKIEDLGYKVDDKKGIVAKILEKVESVAPPEKGSLYNACNKMKCAVDGDLRDKFASQLKSLLKNPNHHQQEAGLRALQDAIYLSATQKRDIAKETIEWLRTLSLDNASQSNSIQSVLIYWVLLPQPLQRDFLDFIFDKLIKRGVNIENINLGFEILRGIEPNLEYEDAQYSAYFDDVYDRAESEGNPQIKSALVEGLLSLKPDKKTKLNRAFWRKVEGLKPSEEG